MTKETALIDLSALVPSEVFVNGGTDRLVKIVEAEIEGFEGDVTTEEGRKEIYHLDRKIASSKTAVDKMRKDYTADVREKLAAINAEGARFVERMEALQQKVSAPLDEWKAKEKERVEALTEKLNIIKDIHNFPLVADSLSIIKAIEAAKSVFEDTDWQDFTNVAGEEYEKAMAFANAKLDQVTRQEEQERELEKMRAEHAALVKANEEERLRKEGEDRAKQEAEAKSLRDKQAADEALRLETLRAAQAEADKIAAEKAAQEARENAVKQAEKAAEEARQAEIARQEAEAAKAAQEALDRENDKKHRAAVNNAAKAALMELGFEEKDAVDIITAIAKGNVPHVKIHY